MTKKSNKAIRRGQRPSFIAPSPSLPTIEEVSSNATSPAPTQRRDTESTSHSRDTSASTNEPTVSANLETHESERRNRFSRGINREWNTSTSTPVNEPSELATRNFFEEDEGYNTDNESGSERASSKVKHRARRSRSAPNPFGSFQRAGQVQSQPSQPSSSSHDLPVEPSSHEEPQHSSNSSGSAYLASSGTPFRTPSAGASSAGPSLHNFASTSSAGPSLHNSASTSSAGPSFVSPFSAGPSSAGFSFAGSSSASISYLTISVNFSTTSQTSDVPSNPTSESNLPGSSSASSSLPASSTRKHRHHYQTDGNDSPDESEDSTSSISSSYLPHHVPIRARQQTSSNLELTVDLTSTALDIASGSSTNTTHGVTGTPQLPDISESAPVTVEPASSTVDSSHDIAGTSQHPYLPESASAPVEPDSLIINHPSQLSSDLQAADRNTESAPDNTSADRDSPLVLVPEARASQQVPEDRSHTEFAPEITSRSQSDSPSVTHRGIQQPSVNDRESTSEYNPSTRASASPILSRSPVADRLRQRSAPVFYGSESDSSTCSSSSPSASRSPVVGQLPSQSDRVESRVSHPESIAQTADSVPYPHVVVITPTKPTADNEQSQSAPPVSSVENQPPDHSNTMVSDRIRGFDRPFIRRPGETTPSTVSSVEPPSLPPSSSAESNNDSEDVSSNVDLTQHSTAASPAAESSDSNVSSSDPQQEECPSTPSNASTSAFAADVNLTPPSRDGRWIFPTQPEPLPRFPPGTPPVAPDPPTAPPFNPFAAFLDTSLPPSVMLDEATRQEAGLASTTGVSIDPMSAYTAEEYRNILHSEQMVLQQMADPHRPNPMRMTAEEEELMQPLTLEDIDAMFDGKDEAKAMRTAEACKQFILSLDPRNTTPAPPIAPAAKRARKAATTSPEAGPSRRTRSSTAALSSSASPAAPVSTRRLRSSDLALPVTASAGRGVDIPEPESWAVACLADKRLSVMKDLGKSWGEILGAWNEEVGEKGKKLLVKEAKKRWGKIEGKIGAWPGFDDALLGTIENLSSELTAELFEKIAEPVSAALGFSVSGEDCSVRYAALKSSGRVEEKGKKKKKGKGRK